MLARPPADISFRDTIEAVDGPLTGDFCPFRTDRCDPEHCIFGTEISRHAAELVAYLSRRTIADVALEAAGLIVPVYSTATPSLLASATLVNSASTAGV